MLPEQGSGDFGSIVNGEHDWVYRKVARDLVTEGRGRSIVRIGWEANGDWFPLERHRSDGAAVRSPPSGTSSASCARSRPTW